MIQALGVHVCIYLVVNSLEAARLEKNDGFDKYQTSSQSRWKMCRAALHAELRKVNRHGARGESRGHLPRRRPHKHAPRRRDARARSTSISIGTTKLQRMLARLARERLDALERHETSLVETKNVKKDATSESKTTAPNKRGLTQNSTPSSSSDKYMWNALGMLHRTAET